MSIRDQATSRRLVLLLLRFDDKGHATAEEFAGPMPAWKVSGIRLALLNFNNANRHHPAIGHIKRFRDHVFKLSWTSGRSKF